MMIMMIMFLEYRDIKYKKYHQIANCSNPCMNKNDFAIFQIKHNRIKQTGAERCQAQVKLG
jgi:hypothetical protein